MDMATALAGLGVTEARLDPDTKDQLDRDGYAPLPGVLSVGQLTAIRARLAELLAAEGDQAGIEVHQDPGPTGSPISSTRARCSSPASPIPGCWPASRTY